MKATLRAGLLIVCGFAAVEWLAIASDYKDSIFLGTYQLKQGEQSATLVLRKDQTFRQDLTRSGSTRSSNGRWRRTGEGVIAFSKEFLPLTGQELDADGTPYANLSKSFGLFPSIALAQSHVLWYSRTDALQGSSVAGTYTADEDDVPAATLVMRAERTFEQTVVRAGVTKHAHGTWSLRDSGDILFSRDFLKASGEPLTEGETASAAKPSGPNLQIEVGVNHSISQPVFKKRLLWY